MNETKTKTKTRASNRSTLICSLLAVLLCCSMLLGTTYAWFTDRVDVGNNRIEAGNLDVTLLHLLADGSYSEVNEKTALFLNAEEENMLWEPCAATEETFRISNDGTLALQYRFAVTFSNATETLEGKTLADALSIRVISIADEAGNAVAVPEALAAGVSLQDFALDGALLEGESHTLRVILFWQPTAQDNDFNLNNGKTGKNGETALSIDLGISLEATQYSYEVDGYGKTYDEALLLPVQYVYTFDELKAAFEAGGYVQLMQDIAVEDTLSLSGKAVLDMNGKTLTVAEGASLDPLIDCAYGAHLTVTGDGKVDLGENKGTSFIAPRGTVIIKNGTYTRDYDPSVTNENEYGSLFIGINVVSAIHHGYTNASSTVIIEDGYFDGGFFLEGKTRGAITGINKSWGQTFLVYGGTYVGYDLSLGDEGTGVQGWFLEGQTSADELPEGYAVSESTLPDGRPVFTFTYEAE